ncbi:MAG: helix-turn-helix transcriptional regulator [Oscillospiraceae bacterium]|nr:helix-turn-helix transcriptional regulator [Oscillospiraceae bacterium]
MKKNLYIRQVGMDPYYKTWHASGNGMLMYMHDGGGSIVSTRRNYPIQPGGLCFIGGNHFHYTLPENPNGYDRSKLFLPAGVLAELLSLLPEELGLAETFDTNALVYTQLEEQDRQYAEQLFAALQREQDSPYLEPLVRSTFLSLLVCLHKNQKKVTAETTDLIQQAVEYINQHISEDISIDSLCRDIHISKYYFCRRFKRVTGFTVMEYLLRTRIVAAKSLLTDSRLPVSEISDRCGFSSFSYFCRVFKEQTGLSPLQYRKNSPIE